MMTVLCRYEATKRECLFEAKTIEYEKGCGVLIVQPDDTSCDLKWSDDPIDDRTFFVMNGSGKTVGVYHLHSDCH